MSSRIRGITIEIDGNAKPLQKEIQRVETETRKMTSGIRDANKLLKFNPTSKDLLTQKQVMYNNALDASKQKLATLKSAYSEMEHTKGFDKNSEDAMRLRREIEATEQEIKQLEGHVRRTSSVLGMQFQAAGQKISGVGQKMVGMGRAMTRSVTMPIAAVAAVGVKKFAEVDKTMQLTNKTMGNTKKEAEMLNNAMKDAASKSTFSMKEAAGATLNFARAGLDAKQSAAALAPAMNLAAGEGGNLETVSGGLVATINGFGDSFEQSSHYADVFANACNNSALDIDNLSKAMSIAAPVFASAGYSVEDASLYMGLMADKGIGAKKAATALKTGIARLVKPTDEAAEYMEKLGISVTDADGNMKDTVTLHKDLQNSFKGLTKAQKIAAASAIFGKNQYSPWLALIDSAPEDVAKLSNELKKQGTTTEMAEAMMSGFGGSIEKLKASVDVAVTSFGEALAPTLRKVADVIQAAADKFNSLSQSQREAIAKAALVAAAIGPVLVIIGKLTIGVGTLVSATGKAMTTFKNIGAALSCVNPMVLAVVASTAALAGMTVAAVKAANYAGDADKALTDKQSKLLESVDANVSAFNKMRDATDKEAEGINTNAETTRGLVDEYNSLINSNGKVKKGYEDRANFIKTELMNSLGLEKSQLEELIGKNGQFKDSINGVIEAKRAEAILNATEDDYAKSLQVKATGQKTLANLTATQISLEKQLAAQQDVTKQKQEAYNKSIGAQRKLAKRQLDESKEAEADTRAAIDETKQKISEQEAAMREANAVIEAREGLMKAVADGDKKAIAEWTEYLLTGNKQVEQSEKGKSKAVERAEKEATRAVQSEGKKQASAAGSAGKSAAKANAKGWQNSKEAVKREARDVGDKAVSSAKSGASGASGAGNEAGSNFGSGFVAGVGSYIKPAINKATELIKSAITAAKNAQDSGSPSKIMIGAGRDFSEGYAIGIRSQMRDVAKAGASLASTAIKNASGTAKLSVLTGANNGIQGRPVLSSSFGTPQISEGNITTNNFNIHIDGAGNANDVANAVIRKIRVAARTA